MSDETKKLTNEAQLSEHGMEKAELFIKEFRGYSHGDISLFIRLLQNKFSRLCTDRMDELIF